MLLLKKLYSEDNCFQPIKFEPGINLICGDKSVDKQGKEVSGKQNSVGKSLSIELINFCLLKKRDHSRVISDVPDKFLPPDSYVCLHFKYKENDYIISRNKNNEIKIKTNMGEAKQYKYEDAKKELNNIFNFSQELSAREYINFAIKEEDYSFKDFVKLYSSGSYIDFLKVHFYFFGIPLDLLKNIKAVFSNYDLAVDSLRNVKDFLDSHDLQISSLKAKKNQFQSDVKKMEENITYDDVIKNVDQQDQDINSIELEITKLMAKKKMYQMDLLEIDDFANFFAEELYVEDDDIETLFNNYKIGLGTFIKHDITELKAFRDQIIRYKNLLLTEKRKNLSENIELLEKQINEKKNTIKEKYNTVLDEKSTIMAKNFKIYKDRSKNIDEYMKIISDYDLADVKKRDSKLKFAELVSKLNKVVESLNEVKESFKTSFNKVHEEIMANVNCNFDFSVIPDFKKESFFNFDIYVDGQGGKGSNQTRAIIYDIALLINDYTKTRNLGFIVHDNLIFGSVDKDTSIKILNYLHTISNDQFQYIATVNTDDFDYAELKKQFEFSMKDKVRIRLTKTKPLFFNDFRATP